MALNLVINRSVATFLAFLPILFAKLQQNDVVEFNQFLGLLSNKPDSLDKSMNGMLSFTWSDCGAATLPGHPNSISISPDPMQLPGNVQIGFTGTLATNLQSPLKAVVSVQKKMFFWIKVPCVDNLGSCTYSDICTIITTCPPPFVKFGIPCHCPITSGNYSLPASPFYIDDSMLPSFLTSGSYRATVQVSDSKQNVACVHVEFSIK